MSLRTLLSAGMLIAGGMLAGRVLGLLREVLLAAQFGADKQADMAIALLILPDFITSALISTAASAALVPAFAARGEARALALFWQAMVASVLAFAALALLIAAMDDSLASLLTGKEVHGEALRLALWSLPLTAGTAVATAWLQHRGRFLVPAFSNAIFNSVVLLTLWLAPTGLMILAGGIVGASLLRVLLHLAAAARAGIGNPAAAFSRSELDARLLKTYATAVGADVFTILPQYVPYGVIAVTGGGLALFNYAFKLAAFPAALGQTVIQMALLPWFVKQRHAAPDPAQLVRAYSTGLKAVWIFGFSLALAVTLASHDLARLCFGYGEMTDESVARIGTLLSIGIWAAPGMMLAAVWQQMLYAHERPGPVLAASLWQVISALLLVTAGEALWRQPGVMAGYALMQWVPLLVLAYLGAKTVGLTFPPSPDYVFSAAAIVLVFLPLAALFAALALPPVPAVLLAMLAGAVLLLSGAFSIQPTRAFLRRKPA